jgi:hypothetical protein
MMMIMMIMMIMMVLMMMAVCGSYGDVDEDDGGDEYEYEHDDASYGDEQRLDIIINITIATLVVVVIL